MGLLFTDFVLGQKEQCRLCSLFCKSLCRDVSISALRHIHLMKKKSRPHSTSLCDQIGISNTVRYGQQSPRFYGIWIQRSRCWKHYNTDNHGCFSAYIKVSFKHLSPDLQIKSFGPASIINCSTKPLEYYLNRINFLQKCIKLVSIDATSCIMNLYVSWLLFSKTP